MPYDPRQPRWMAPSQLPHQKSGSIQQSHFYMYSYPSMPLQGWNNSVLHDQAGNSYYYYAPTNSFVRIPPPQPQAPATGFSPTGPPPGLEMPRPNAQKSMQSTQSNPEPIGSGRLRSSSDPHRYSISPHDLTLAAANSEPSGEHVWRIRQRCQVQRDAQSCAKLVSAFLLDRMRFRPKQEKSLYERSCVSERRSPLSNVTNVM
jgi:hypothetical protein